MKSIILPIHPEHAGRIFGGTKTGEFRRKIPVSEIGRVYFYVTGTMEIQGFFDVDEIISFFSDSSTCFSIGNKYDPSLHWNEVFKYFHGSASGYMYKIKSFEKFRVPVKWKELSFNYKIQGLKYLTHEQEKEIIEKSLDF